MGVFLRTRVGSVTAPESIGLTTASHGVAKGEGQERHLDSRRPRTGHSEGSCVARKAEALNSIAEPVAIDS